MCHVSIRVATFNILHGQRADGSGIVDLPLLIDSAAALRPDILALQEVDVGVPRSGRTDQAGAVADALGLQWVFGKAARVGGVGKYGNALLARGPITEVEVVPLPKTRPLNEPRSAIVATVEVYGVAISVCATHLSIHRREVQGQLIAAADAVRKRRGPRLLIGDLNLRAERVAPLIEQRRMLLADPAEPTFPRHEPRIRIDHVAASGMAFETVEVVPTASSDHCALVVEVAVDEFAIPM